MNEMNEYDFTKKLGEARYIGTDNKGHIRYFGPTLSDIPTEAFNVYERCEKIDEFGPLYERRVKGVILNGKF